MNSGLLRSRMQKFVEQGKYPGILALVWRAGKVVSCEAVGTCDLSRPAPIRRDTIFRLASMSKPITSVAALVLIEEGRLRLEDPIRRWLPEAADLTVLRTPQSEIDDVVPLERQPTIFDLMTHTSGIAWTKGPDFPVTRAMVEAAGMTPFVPFDPDTLVKRVCSVPLMRQPGSGWSYGLSTDLLGVVIARASNSSLPEILRRRVLEPIGMVDTGFFVPQEKLDRLSVAYDLNAQGQLTVQDDARTGFWTRQPVFPSGGGGLVSTTDDYLAFAAMLLNKGRVGKERILSEESVKLMTSNQLPTPQLRAFDPRVDFLQGQGFGLGVSITLVERQNRRRPGSFSWPGGYGTTWFADPQQELIALWMTQRWLDSQVETGPAFEDAVYEALTAGSSQ